MEVANDNHYDTEKGKPLSEYEYVKKIDNLWKPKILEFLNQIVGIEAKKTAFTQQELEILVVEPSHE